MIHQSWEKNRTILKEVIFMDHVPIKQKSDIHQGGHVRRYYAWITLNKMVESVIPFRRENGDINWHAIRCMFKKDSKIWIEYGCGTTAHLLALLASFIRSNGIVLNIHDFAVIQRRDFSKNPPFLKRFRLQVIERLLIKRSYAIILAWPRMLDYFKPGRNQQLLIMVPGVGEDELITHLSNKNKNSRKIALYFGGMRRKGMIPWISELFSELNEWELHLVGLKEKEEILERENVKYTGSVSHNKLFDIICNVDLVLIPNPKNDYMDRFIPMKAAYTLLSCKPVIASRLRGLSEYISMVGLEDNVIYLDDWNRDSLKEALEKAENIKIDVEKTIEKLRPLSWEPRFKKAIEIVFDESKSSIDQFTWI
ncbi:MAG TPA: glycosyltransferase [candidate division Zixibacteria bacterium]|nr:glycosyltransferase [candidate division Zixibacteria bacterium]